MDNTKKYLAEMLGTMVLVLIGCGSAVFTGIDVSNAASVLTVAFAFGLTVLAMVYTIGNISGCHINPAITMGMLVAKRISLKDASFYMIFQVIGGIIGSAIIYLILSNYTAVTSTTTGANGYKEGTMIAALIAETIFTFIFVWVVLASTANEKQSGFAGIAIGLTLVFVHIVCIPITGTSVNPARSIGPALFQGGVALEQLWLFIVAPLAGGVIAAGCWKMLRK